MDIEIFLDLFEAVTVLCFGIAWPICIRKSLISKTAKGKSLFFDIFLLIGCAVLIMKKLISIEVLEAGGFVFYLGLLVYVLSFIGILADIVIYFRNKKLDTLAGKQEDI